MCIADKLRSEKEWQHCQLLLTI